MDFSSVKEDVDIEKMKMVIIAILEEILVTKATEPSWIPIFINAAGVITDIVKDGDMLEVDGNNGIVKIIKE